MARCAACALVLVAAAASASAQVPAGPEFRVNTYTTLNQYFQSVGSDADGNFVITWNSLIPDTQIWSVFGQRYDAAGVPRGQEFLIPTFTTEHRRFPRMGSDAKGNFVVGWNRTDGSDYGVFAQRCSADGARLGAEFRVNTYTTARQLFPAIATDADGDFVIVWSSDGQDGSDAGVFGQRFDRTGAPRGLEFQVNTYTTRAQFRPHVASDAEGNFVVVWSSFPYQAGSAYVVFARRYDQAGAPRGSEFRVNTYTTASQLSQDVVLAPNGDFLVVWQGINPNNNERDLFARRYQASGAPQGGEFRVNSTGSNYNGPAEAALDARGNFLVAWRNMDNVNDVAAQRFDSSGEPRGDQFRVNAYTTQAQGYNRVTLASDAVGNFVVAWPSQYQDGSLLGVFAQRFGGLRPVALDVDTTGNHVFEPGETVDLRPTWRNVNGLAQTFGGTLTNIGGPTGAVYSIGDPTASYGTVANNASAQCIDCYGVSVSSPPQRPVTHWDVSAIETTTPDAHGQQIRWLLHLGDSFTDVPRTNPFYGFVETMLHHGVTAGCSGTAYCPSSPTTREQMAVFVLIAKEGAGYAPPGCAPPNIFADVPETSAFCGFIEELSNRGVVGGCGGGNYCPASPVTREQMAVFVLRTLDPALDPPACAPPNMFNDVPDTSAFCKWIEELARRGVVSGCGGGNYCPTAPVTREQMGVFLGVTFGLTLYGP